MSDAIVLACCVTPAGLAFALVFTRWLTGRNRGYRRWAGEE